jgi:hypothetical protein
VPETASYPLYRPPPLPPHSSSALHHAVATIFYTILNRTATPQLQTALDAPLPLSFIVVTHPYCFKNGCWFCTGCGVNESSCPSKELHVLTLNSGTGYIGSFTALALLEADYKVVIVDSLYNSSKEVINRIELICGKRPEFYEADITDEAALDKVFDQHPDIDNVIHFAALKVIFLPPSAVARPPC